jgi:hypothetical protein
MKTEKEIKYFLARCDKARGHGMSKKRCPAENGRRKGCCAECSMPSALRWVLGEEVIASHNMQHQLIEVFNKLTIEDKL